MFKNYFKIAWRNLKKNRLYAFVNITGLTIGIVSCLLIGIYIKEELSFDKFNKNADRIVRVTEDYGVNGIPQKIAVTGTKVGPQFKRTFPAISDFVRVEKRSAIISYNNRLFDEPNVLYADPSFLHIFSYNLVNGDTTALNTTEKIIVTETSAKKYFDNDNPVGKTLKVGDKNFIVSAVAADAPSNSQLKFDFIVSFGNLNAAKTEKWSEANYITYLLLKDPSKFAPLQRDITAYMKKVNHDEQKMAGQEYMTFNLERLTDVHLRSNLPDSPEPGGSMTYIYIMIVVAVLILIIACVNYINLSIAQSAGRSAEIGIRKVMGAGKSQLFRQFIGESVFVTAIGVLLAFGLAFLLLPSFNHLSGKDFNFNSLLDPVMLGTIVLLGAFIGFAAGSYPALLLSGVKLVKILKAGFSFTSGQGVRKSLIVFQFVISIFLIVTTIVILQQLSFIRNKDIGYNKSNVVVLPVNWRMLQKVEGLKNELKNIPGVQGVAAANNEPINVAWGDGITTADGKSMSVNALPMDEDFIKTMQLQIIEGENFTRGDYALMDTSNQGKNYHYTFMLNESAVRQLGWTPKEAIGKEISKGVTGKIKAVVKDFNFKSFHDPIGPLLIFLDKDQTQDIFIRINGNNTTQAIAAMQRIWKERVPERPFSYKFLDDDYDAMYRAEQRTAGVFTTFSGLAILLACLGLFAVTAYAVVQRTKEIGIRKVLGASVSGIVMLISKDFLVLIIIATLIASPVAWYAAHVWLQDFAYRINIHWWIFIAAGVASLVVAALTVSVQAIKAALTNPVKSLKSE
ncbi:MAG TPA: FtsX-like permease family protein [Mucilaginibacter sp.]